LYAYSPPVIETLALVSGVKGANVTLQLRGERGSSTLSFSLSLLISHTHSLSDRYIDRQSVRQTDRQAGRQSCVCCVCCVCVVCVACVFSCTRALARLPHYHPHHPHPRASTHLQEKTSARTLTGAWPATSTSPSIPTKRSRESSRVSSAGVGSTQGPVRSHAFKSNFKTKL
jgi:hypothetical protein